MGTETKPTTEIPQDIANMTPAAFRELQLSDPKRFAEFDATIRARGETYLRMMMEIITTGAREGSLQDSRATVASGLHSALYGADPERSSAPASDPGIQATAVHATGLLIRVLWSAIGTFAEDMILRGADLPKLEAHGRLAQVVSLDIGHNELLATSRPGEIPAAIRTLPLFNRAGE